MDLDIAESFNSRIITPYNFMDRTYYLLFFMKGVVGPFCVSDSPYVLENSMLALGDIKIKHTDQVVGHIFHTTSKVNCGGSFLLAYSGVFKESLVTSIPKDFNMDLVLKSQYVQVFNRRNRATLVISPHLRSSIKDNLEI